MDRRFHPIPTTFEAPSLQDLEALKPDSLIKIHLEFLGRDQPPVQGERFWVKLTDVGENLTGLIDNELVFTDLHGLELSDQITFERRHVYQVLAINQVEEARVFLGLIDPMQLLKSWNPPKKAVAEALASI